MGNEGQHAVLQLAPAAFVAFANIQEVDRPGEVRFTRTLLERTLLDAILFRIDLHERTGRQQRRHTFIFRSDISVQGLLEAEPAKQRHGHATPDIHDAGKKIGLLNPHLRWKVSGLSFDFRRFLPWRKQLRRRRPVCRTLPGDVTRHAVQLVNLVEIHAVNLGNEVFWLLDAATKKVVAVNRAYETVTGRSLESIENDPSSYEDLIHAGDRAHVLAKLENAVHSGHLDEEFRTVRPDGEVRWVWVKASPVRASDNAIRQLYGTAQDITAKKLADAQVAEHLVAAETARAEAESASAEAEALRRATLALTQNLRMDAVLDTLLQTLFQIVAYDAASVILTEENERLFVAREAPPAASNRPVVTLETSDSAILQRVLVLKRATYVPDTREESEWRDNKAFSGVRSWIAVPLVVSDSVVGLLSIGSKQPRAFTTRHFHLAKLLAIPAAVAIHNARLYEWAQIYAAERQTLLKKLDQTADENADPPRERFPN